MDKVNHQDLEVEVLFDESINSDPALGSCCCCTAATSETVDEEDNK